MSVSKNAEFCRLYSPVTDALPVPDVIFIALEGPEIKTEIIAKISTNLKLLNPIFLSPGSFSVVLDDADYIISPRYHVEEY
jgi:hypothetical protein